MISHSHVKYIGVGESIDDLQELEDLGGTKYKISDLYNSF